MRINVTVWLDADGSINGVQEAHFLAKNKPTISFVISND